MSEVTWYHGTRRPFEKGGLLLPAAVHGGGQANVLPDYPDAGDWVFITPDRDVAEGFALSATTGRARPRILRVEPVESVFGDAATYGGEDGLMYRTKAARVVAVEILEEPS